MRLHRQSVEHPFGTIKAWMGYTHFLTRMLPTVRTEMSVQVLAYNLRRVLNILGSSDLLEAAFTASGRSRPRAAVGVGGSHWLRDIEPGPFSRPLFPRE
jgi:hypothetical protein